MASNRAQRYVVRNMILLGALFLIGTCVSRYRLELYLTSQGFSEKVKIEETRFLMDRGLSDPYASEKTEPDTTSLLVIRTGVRWRHSEGVRPFMLGFDEYLRCLLYLELPPLPTVDTIPLQGRCLVQVLGRYDLPPESKIFLPDTGRVVIDSVPSDEIFGTVNVLFKNNVDFPLAFNGQFKAKMKR